MLRGFIRLILLCGVGLVVAPFLVSSLYVDQRGIEILGRVHHKSETIITSYSTWKRSLEASIQYDLPKGAGVSFFTAFLNPEQYDALHPGNVVKVHYLRQQDIPDLPFTKVLWQMHMLPVVRLADQQTFSRVKELFTPNVIFFCEAIAGFAVLLWIWRLAGWGGLPWVIVGLIAVGIAVSEIRDFPKPTPQPSKNVLRGVGRVKSVSRIDRLFQGSHERGILADQPINVVGVEFVPVGRTEPVVAVDLVDANSQAVLQENTNVEIEYEADSPRTAYLQKATRTFLHRNLMGTITQVVLSVLVIAVILFLGNLLGRGYRKLLARKVQ
jgi:hypothetical protein